MQGRPLVCLDLTLDSFGAWGAKSDVKFTRGVDVLSGLSTCLVLP